MARNMPNKQHTDDGAEREAAQPGGASGVPADPNPEHAEIGGAKVKAGAVVEAKKTDEAPAVSKRYRVVGGANPDERGRFRVMYDGMPVAVAMGKEYDEHQCDLALLKRQGIRFEEVAPAE